MATEWKLLVKLNRKVSHFIFYAAVLVSSLKSCAVSMNEPFYQVTFHEIVWQYLMPACTLSLAAAFIYAKGLAVLEKRAKIEELAIAIMLVLLPVALSVEAIYGYTYDLSHFVGIR